MKVFHYDTHEILEGNPSRELLREARNAPIQAYKDGSGMWQFVPQGQSGTDRYRGLEIVTVYLSKGL